MDIQTVLPKWNLLQYVVEHGSVTLEWAHSEEQLLILGQMTKASQQRGQTQAANDLDQANASEASLCAASCTALRTGDSQRAPRHSNQLRSTHEWKPLRAGRPAQSNHALVHVLRIRLRAVFGPESGRRDIYAAGRIPKGSESRPAAFLQQRAGNKRAASRPCELLVSAAPPARAQNFGTDCSALGASLRTGSADLPTQISSASRAR